jgi:hypothetical protein
LLGAVTPSEFAAKVAFPDRTVISLIGDGICAEPNSRPHPRPDIPRIRE